MEGWLPSQTRLLFLWKGHCIEIRLCVSVCVYRYTAQLHAAWQMAELKFSLIVKSCGLKCQARNIHLSIQYERGLGSVSAPVNYNTECNAAQRILVHFYLDWLSMWTLTVIILTRIAFVFCVYELQRMQVVTKLKKIENNCAFLSFFELATAFAFHRRKSFMSGWWQNWYIWLNCSCKCELLFN